MGVVCRACNKDGEFFTVDFLLHWLQIRPRSLSVMQHVHSVHMSGAGLPGRVCGDILYPGEWVGEGGKRWEHKPRREETEPAAASC